MITKKALRALLEKYSQASVDAWLIRWVCNHVGYDPASLLNDISQQGCGSGIVGELIYHYDCRAFYARFEKSIWEKVTDFLDNTGDTVGQFLDGLRPSVQDELTMKVMLSWFAVEETAYQLLAHFESDNA